jgi:hypothetical protein
MDTGPACLLPPSAERKREEEVEEACRAGSFFREFTVNSAEEG